MCGRVAGQWPKCQSTAFIPKQVCFKKNGGEMNSLILFTNYCNMIFQDNIQPFELFLKKINIAKMPQINKECF